MGGIKSLANSAGGGSSGEGEPMSRAGAGPLCSGAVGVAGD